jgi:hypothetical protein
MPWINEIDEVQELRDVLEQIRKEIDEGFIKPDEFNNKKQKDKDVRVQDKGSRKHS